MLRPLMPPLPLNSHLHQVVHLHLMDRLLSLLAVTATQMEVEGEETTAEETTAEATASVTVAVVGVTVGATVGAVEGTAMVNI